MEKEWKNVQTNGRGQEYVKARELSGGIRSSCRAIFFRNTHETTGEKIVSLKIARLNKSNGLLTEKQNKSVTLNSDELGQHRTIAEASAVESPIRQETIGFPAHFFARAHNFKPGRACQPEADSPMRT